MRRIRVGRARDIRTPAGGGGNNGLKTPIKARCFQYAGRGPCLGVAQLAGAVVVGAAAQVLRQAGLTHLRLLPHPLLRPHLRGGEGFGGGGERVKVRAGDEEGEGGQAVEGRAAVAAGPGPGPRAAAAAGAAAAFMRRRHAQSQRSEWSYMMDESRRRGAREAAFDNPPHKHAVARYAGRSAGRPAVGSGEVTCAPIRARARGLQDTGARARARRLSGGPRRGHAHLLLEPAYLGLGSLSLVLHPLPQLLNVLHRGRTRVTRDTQVAGAGGKGTRGGRVGAGVASGSEDRGT